MKKNIAIIILTCLLILTGLAYSGANDSRDIAQTRLEGCRTMVEEIDDLLAEVDMDYRFFSETITNYLTYNISEEKAYSDIELLLDNRDRYEYRYNLTIDKYNNVCFEL